MKGSARTLIRIFVTGALAALPLAATIAVFAWAANVLFRWLGPESPIGSVLVAIGFGVTGSEVVGYLMGVAVVVLLIFGLGLLVEAGLQRGIASLVNAVVRRIPLVNSVYDIIRRVVALFAQRDAEGNGMKSMRAVWCHFGGPGGDGAAVALALLSNAEPVMIEGRRCVAVLVPTAPVPVGGGLLWVPEAWVTPADIGIEGVTSIYVSMGLTASQYLPPAPPAPPAGTAPAAAPAP